MRRAQLAWLMSGVFLVSKPAAAGDLVNYDVGQAAAHSGKKLDENAIKLQSEIAF